MICVDCGERPARPRQGASGTMPKRCVECQHVFILRRTRRAQAKHRLKPGVREREAAYARAVQATPDGRARNTTYRREWVQRQREAGVHTTQLLTREEFEAMLGAQGGVCAICLRPETNRSAKGRVRRLAIDHDHATGRVRALLCSRCNTAVGNVREDPDIADRLAAYLRWEAQRDAMAKLNAALGGAGPTLIRPLRRHHVQAFSVAAAERMQEALSS